MAGNLVSTASIPNQKDPGYLFIQNAYPRMRKGWEADFKERKIYRAYEETSTNTLPGPALFRAEGTATPLGNIYMSGKKRFNVLSYGMKIGITLEILEDNLYDEMGPQYAEALLQSQLECANIQAASVLNNAENPAYVGWDGLPLLSTDHPVTGGTISNKVEIDSPIQENSLFDMLTMMWYFRAPSGIHMDKVEALHLTIAPPAARQVRVLLDSQFRPGTASLELNPSNGAVLNSFEVNRYIKQNIYFLRTNQRGLWYFNRQSFRIADDPNVDTWAIMLSSLMRYVFGFDDFRCVLGGKSAVTGNS